MPHNNKDNQEYKMITVTIYLLTMFFAGYAIYHVRSK